jgi:dinuclear metal center YbgI/SA1388 family protein
MIPLRTLVSALDTELNTKAITDYPGAWNGLQVANAAESVTKVATAVDACLPVIQSAVRAGADLLIVHHGLFWSGVQMVDGAYFKKLKLAMDYGLAIYSNHLPLDYHASLGNNILLANALDLGPASFFGEQKGLPLGVRITTDIFLGTLLEVTSQAVDRAVHVSPGGPRQCKNIAICTGAAGSEVAKFAAHGIDTFITGEGPHHSYALAQELGINLIYAGHYATETFGVKALGTWLEQKYSLPHTFIHHPSGL